MPKTRPNSPARLIGLVVGFAVLVFLVGGMVGFLEGTGRLGLANDGGLVWVTLPLAIVLVGFSFWVGAFWMKSIDEAAREAHKWSWYWGGSAGLAVAMIGYLLSFLPESSTWELPTVTGRADPMAYAVTGGLAVVVLMMVGYLIAWGLWWLQRR
ncbi:hypothetical protein [Brevundimonas vesicularis]|uniref:hypothetical protein n=1 Tax=Brevundimonas vesicularis TaxID=41276 RepID=UPI0038D40E70